MENKQKTTEALLYRSRGGKTASYASCILFGLACVAVFIRMQENETALLLRFGTAGLILPWIFAIAGVLLLYGAVSLFLSRVEIYSDRVVGTPFSYLTRKTVTIPRQQIQRVETEPKSGMLVLHTASGKHSFACKDLQKAYEILQG